MAKFMGDDDVGKSLRDNIVSAGIVIDHTVDKGGLVKVKGTKANLKWRGLPNSLGR